jgi:hypothetical protein
MFDSKANRLGGVRPRIAAATVNRLSGITPSSLATSSGSWTRRDTFERTLWKTPGLATNRTSNNLIETQRTRTTSNETAAISTKPINILPLRRGCWPEKSLELRRCTTAFRSLGVVIETSLARMRTETGLVGFVAPLRRGKSCPLQDRYSGGHRNFRLSHHARRRSSIDIGLPHQADGARKWQAIDFDGV